MKRVSFEMEFIFRASPAILYTFLTTPACLVRWFCDGVDINTDVFTFTWDGADENAEMLDDIQEERVRFKWEDADEGEYLEFRMYKSGVTNETVLEITDFCDDDEVDSQMDLWNTQLKKLKTECGG
ncbi:MAG TPA: activator of HSP90 ATPase 1 family protein [Saprospirales bacterium]|nr:activator of HSP90 ATPase 1 family protein [Saprospiraceae bacterium]HAW05945.1 activator of HSP90 ATPase 1 family protein [Saprospirales bacterium]